MDSTLPREKGPLENIKVSKNARISLDKYGFTIILQNYDVDATVLNGSFGASGDWTIDDLLIAATRVKTISEAISGERGN